MAERDDISGNSHENDQVADRAAVDELESDAVAEQAEAFNAASPPESDPTVRLRGLVTFLIQNLVDNPDEVSISVEQRGQLVHIQLHVPEDEMGKVIGRGGRIAKAIRTALMITGSQYHVRVNLDIEN